MFLHKYILHTFLNWQIITYNHLHHNSEHSLTTQSMFYNREMIMEEIHLCRKLSIFLNWTLRNIYIALRSDMLKNSIWHGANFLRREEEMSFRVKAICLVELQGEQPIYLFFILFFYCYFRCAFVCFVLFSWVFFLPFLFV